MIKVNKKVDSFIEDLRLKSVSGEKPYVKVFEDWTHLDSSKEGLDDEMTWFRTEVNQVHTPENNDVVRDIFDDFQILLTWSDPSRQKRLHMRLTVYANEKNEMTFTRMNRTVYNCKKFPSQKQMIEEIERVITDFEMMM